MSAHKNIAIGLFCVDWRLYQPEVRIAEKARETLGVDAIDVMAVPGPDGLLADGRENEFAAVVGSFKLLIGAHNPSVLAVVAHYRCAGHPREDGEHDSDAAAVAARLKEALGFSGPVVALSATYVNDSQWGLKEVARA